MFTVGKKAAAFCGGARACKRYLRSLAPIRRVRIHKRRAGAHVNGGTVLNLCKVGSRTKEKHPFVLDGQDWFAVSGPSDIDWPAIRQAVDREQRAPWMPWGPPPLWAARSGSISSWASRATGSITPDRYSC
jgi:hypothetical protein